MVTKLLIGLSDECNDSVRHACGSKRPLGPYIEGLLVKTPEIKKAAKALGLKLPKRMIDGRGKYERHKDTKRTGYH